MVLGFRMPPWPTFSSASTEPIQADPAMPAAQALACPSSPQWPPPTVAPSATSRRLAAARPSASSCPGPDPASWPPRHDLGTGRTTGPAQSTAMEDAARGGPDGLLGPADDRRAPARSGAYEGGYEEGGYELARSVSPVIILRAG